MKVARWLVALCVLASLACGGEESHNANSRYTVESVVVVPAADNRLSPELRRDIDRIVGGKFDPVMLANLSGRIRREVNARMVLNRLSRGTQPEHVKVVFEIVRRKTVEVSATRLAYHSRQGPSAAVDFALHRGANTLIAGLVSDNEDLLERFTGYRLRYDRDALGATRAAFRLDFESYHQQWDESTIRASAPGEIYRTRFNVQPSVNLRLTPGLTVSAGVSLQQFQLQFPAARSAAANSVVNTLRYRRSWESTGASQTLDAAYTLRAATRALSSDYVYARHLVSGHYEWHRGRDTVRVTGMGGLITGQPPLFERFSLGNSTTLRGWSKYDVLALGGSHLSYGSAEYRYSIVHGFYDCGSVWNPGQRASVKHAVGGGVHTGSLYFSIGFPVGGHAAGPHLFDGYELLMSDSPFLSRRALLVGTAAALSGALRAHPAPEVRNRDEQLYLVAPQFHFLTGRPLDRLHDGHSVGFEFQLALSLQQRGPVLRRCIERFLVSYDLWEEKFAVLRARRDSRSISNLDATEAEAWCLDHVMVPAAEVPREAPLWVRLDVRAEDASGVARAEGEGGFDLTGLIDIFSRPGRDRQMRWSLEAGPVQLRTIGREPSRR